MSFSETLSYQILKAMGDENPVQSLLNIGAEDLKQPLFLMNITGRQIDASSRHKVSEGTFKKGTGPMTAYPIKTGAHHLLYICVPADRDSLSSMQDELLKQLAKTLGLYFHNMEFTQCQSAKELFLYDFLDRSQKSRQVLLEQCKISGILYQDHYQLMMLCNSQNISDIPVFHIAKLALQQILPDSVMVTHHNRLVILCRNVLINQTFSQTRHLTDILTKYHLTAAVSLPFENIGYVHQAYIQTLQALDEGLIVDSSDNLYLYQDYLPYHALSYIKNEKEICHPCIWELTAYDAIHHTDYVHTLYTYITNFRNMKDTAQAMSIHYNTLKYRMKKLEQLLDFSLDDSNLFLILYLSFKYLRLHGHIF